MVKYTFGYFELENEKCKINYATYHYVDYLLGCSPLEFNSKYPCGITLYEYTPNKIQAHMNLHNENVFMNRDDFVMGSHNKVHYTVKFTNKNYSKWDKCLSNQIPIRLCVTHKNNTYVWGYFIVTNERTSNNGFSTFTMKLVQNN